MLTNVRKITKELWTAVVIGGLISIIFGLITMIWPRETLNIFIYLFSVFVLIVSVIILGQALSNMKIDRLWWMSMLFSLCGICMALYVIINPDIARQLIAILLAVYIFCQSFMDLIIASYADKSDTKTPMIVTGIAGIIVGFIMIFLPNSTINAITWLIGLCILAHGLVTEYYALKTRSRRI